MAEQESVRVQLDYPLEQVKEPIIYHLVVDYHLVPNIRRANIYVHTGGMLVLQLDGTRENLEEGIADYIECRRRYLHACSEVR